MKLQGGDISGAMKIIVKDETVASLTNEVLKALKDKHPDPPADLAETVCVVHSLFIDASPAELDADLKSYAPGSSAGPDGLRPQHSGELKKLPGDAGQTFFCTDQVCEPRTCCKSFRLRQESFLWSQLDTP